MDSVFILFAVTLGSTLLSVSQSVPSIIVFPSSCEQTFTDTSVDVASIEDVQDTYTAAVSGMGAVNISTSK